MDIKIKQININLLKEHPHNFDIYQGSYSDDDLVESIRTQGLQNPLIVNKDFQILSGHRRFKALKELGYKEIPVQIKNFQSKDEELIFLITENIYRQKTNIEKIKEAGRLEDIEKKLAKERMKTGKKSDKAGTTAGKIAKIIGMSETNYVRGKKVLSLIDKLIKGGNIKEADKLKTKLNKSINSAYKEISDDKYRIIKKSKKIKKNKDPLYWEILEQLLNDIDRAKTNLDYIVRTNKLPAGLKAFVKDLKNMEKCIESWNPKKMQTCPKCQGISIRKKCKWCFKGKTGVYHNMHKE